MARTKKLEKRLPSGQLGRAKVTAKEALKRLEEFASRKESFVAAVRKGKDRSVSA